MATTAIDGTRCGHCGGALVYDAADMRGNTGLHYSSWEGRFNWTLTCAQCGMPHQHQCLDGVTVAWVMRDPATGQRVVLAVR